MFILLTQCTSYSHSTLYRDIVNCKEIQMRNSKRVATACMYFSCHSQLYVFFFIFRLTFSHPIMLKCLNSAMKADTHYAAVWVFRLVDSFKRLTGALRNNMNNTFKATVNVYWNEWIVYCASIFGSVCHLLYDYILNNRVCLYVSHSRNMQLLWNLLNRVNVLDDAYTHCNWNRMKTTRYFITEFIIWPLWFDAISVWTLETVILSTITWFLYNWYTLHKLLLLFYGVCVCVCEYK